MASVWRALTRLQPILLVLAFGAMALLLSRRWAALAATAWRLRPGWLGASAVLLVGGWLLEVGIWRRVLAWFSGRLPYRHAVVVWLSSAVVRYLPGNIWQPLSLTVRCQRLGVRPVATIAGTALLHILNIVAALLVGALYLTIWGAPGGVPLAGAISIWWAVPLATPVVLLLVWPGAVTRLASRGLVAAGSTPIPPGLTRGRVATGVGASFLMWMLPAAAFAAFAAGAAVPQGAPSIPLARLAAAYPIAYAIGFLSFVTPSGIGVREGVLYALAAPIIGASPALVAALGMRVWEVAIELLVAGLVVTWSFPEER